ncbi:MAG TPA: MFS transporter [Caulobacteraceae bacterium]
MTSQPTPASGRSLDLSTKLFFGFGSVAFGAKTQLLGLLLLFYNQIVGLPAQWVSLALAISITIDALWDPLIGQLSDGTRTRWGRRHPYMYAVALPLAVSFAALWRPPAGLSQGGLFAYLLVMIVVVRMLISLHEIPSTSLTPELAKDYDQRTNLLSYRYFFGAMGGAAAAILGLGVFLAKTPQHPFGQLNRAGYGPYSIAVAIITFVAILISAMGTHRHIPFLYKPPKRRVPLMKVFREIGATISNRNFVVIIVAATIFGLTLGLSGGLSIYFSTYFWGLPSAKLLFLALAAFPATLMGAMLAPPAARRLGKKRACVTMFFISIFINIIPIGGRLIGVMPPNSSPLLLPILIAATLVTGCLGTMGFIIVTSMIADIVEETQLKTGRRSEGLLFSADTFLQKVASGVATLLPGLLLAFVRFPLHASPETLDPAIMRHLAIIYLPLTVGLSLCSTTMLLFYRIDRRSHEDNLRRLADSAALLEMVDPDNAGQPEGPAVLTRPL